MLMLLLYVYDDDSGDVDGDDDDDDDNAVDGNDVFYDDNDEKIGARDRRPQKMLPHIIMMVMVRLTPTKIPI